MHELALFAGIGGGVLASEIIGDRTVCAVERDAYAASVLAQRQNDGVLPVFPIWSDVRSFDGRPWRGIVDSVAGGFPCQDISIAGNGAGIDGVRSGLWSEFARIIREVEPGIVRVENSPMLASRGLTRVLGDLAQMGFDAEWDVISAADLGAWFATGDRWPTEPGLVRMVHGVPHRVDRIKCLGNAQVPRVAAAAFTALQDRLINS